MALLFISDLHLSAERPDIIRLFTSFLQRYAQGAESLYILGDLFEVWLGDDYIPEELQTVFDALRSYTTNHPVFIQHGNRDFLLGSDFEALTGAKIIPDPSIIEINGVLTLISHGDELCTDDVEYMEFRKQVRNPTWQREFLAKPIVERIRMGRDARKESKTRTQQKSLEIMDVNQHAVEQFMQAHQVRQLIHGHTHRPNTHHFVVNNEKMTRIVLGDWYQQGSVLRCGEDGCRLQTLSMENASDS